MAELTCFGCSGFDWLPACSRSTLSRGGGRSTSRFWTFKTISGLLWSPSNDSVATSVRLNSPWVVQRPLQVQALRRFLLGPKLTEVRKEPFCHLSLLISPFWLRESLIAVPSEQKQVATFCFLMWDKWRLEGPFGPRSCRHGPAGLPVFPPDAFKARFHLLFIYFSPEWCLFCLLKKNPQNIQISLTFTVSRYLFRVWNRHNILYL